MIRNIIKRICTRENMVIFSRHKSAASTAVQQFDLDETEEIVDNQEEEKRREEEIQRKRNKSRLQTQHYNVVHGRPPYSDPQMEFHKTVRYHQKLYGKYGEASGVDPSICWPTAVEIQQRKQYEQIAYPYTIQQIMKENEAKKAEYEAQRQKRQNDILVKFGKLEQWKKDLRNRLEKKEAEARAVKERKDRLVEEVRRHFGFKIDPKDERFKEMLENKEKAEKKAMKEARKKIKEQRMIAKLQSLNKSETDTKQPESKSLDTN